MSTSDNETLAELRRENRELRAALQDVAGRLEAAESRAALATRDARAAWEFTKTIFKTGRSLRDV